MQKQISLAGKPTSSAKNMCNGSKSPSVRCPIKEAVMFLAGAWTLEIYWHLSQQKLRFGELRRHLVGVSPKVLTQRLRDLEDLGVVERTVLDTYPPQVEYELSSFGKKFIPILDQIAEVGSNLTRKSKRN
ncbi:MAG: winged helix-turn-helix transcriptional regulator [Pseudobdellovibrionaceae bacterium]